MRTVVEIPLLSLALIVVSFGALCFAGGWLREARRGHDDEDWRDNDVENDALVRDWRSVMGQASPERSTSRQDRRRSVGDVMLPLVYVGRLYRSLSRASAPRVWRVLHRGRAYAGVWADSVVSRARGLRAQRDWPVTVIGVPAVAPCDCRRAHCAECRDVLPTTEQVRLAQLALTTPTAEWSPVVVGVATLPDTLESLTASSLEVNR